MTIALKFSVVKWNQGLEFLSLTSRAVQRSFWGFPTISTVTLVKGKALVTCSCYHFKILREIFRFHERFQFVDFSCIGVWQVEWFRHRVHSQIVLVGGACAKKEENISYKAISSMWTPGVSFFGHKWKHILIGERIYVFSCLCTKGLDTLVCFSSNGSRCERIQCILPTCNDADISILSIWE